MGFLSNVKKNIRNLKTKASAYNEEREQKRYNSLRTRAKMAKIREGRAKEELKYERQIDKASKAERQLSNYRGRSSGMGFGGGSGLSIGGAFESQFSGSSFGMPKPATKKKKKGKKITIHYD